MLTQWLYDYQKNIADQAKNISSLEKQLAAYRNDTSEEARKKRLELQQQLDDSRTNLKETQWDKYISETNEMLSNMSEDYQNFLNSKLDDIKTVIENVVTEINGNKKAVSDGLKEISNEYGITTQHFEDFRKNTYSKSQAGIVSAFNNANTEFKNGWSKVKSAILEVNRTLLSKQTDVTNTNNDNNGATTNNEKAEAGMAQSTNIKALANGGLKIIPTGGTTEDKDLSKVEAEKAKDIANEEKQKAKAKEKATTETKVKPKNAWWRGKWYDAKGKVVSKYSLGEFIWDSTGQWYRYAVAGDKEWHWEKDCSRTIDGKIYYFDKKGYVIQSKTKKAPGYAKGTSNVPEDQFAWTQEEGSELIYRTTDGAILTPLNQGDMVFTHDMTQRLWEIAKNNIPTGTQGAAVVRTTANFGDSNINAAFTINLPNVKNYDEFKKELQNDNNFEKFVQEITVGRLNGNNSLNKRKY